MHSFGELTTYNYTYDNNGGTTHGRPRVLHLVPLLSYCHLDLHLTQPIPPASRLVTLPWHHPEPLYASFIIFHI